MENGRKGKSSENIAFVEQLADPSTLNLGLYDLSTSSFLAIFTILETYKPKSYNMSNKIMLFPLEEG